MINQATALLIETGKIGREMSHVLRGPHRPELYHSAAAEENEPNDAEQLDLRIELGRTRADVEEASSLRKGSVLMLDGTTEEPVAIFAGPRLIGRGEIVVVNGKIGVRVVELTE
jgi:flagellar motor switch protein FliN